MESGKIRFIGCTVDNPFHSLRSSLVSRCQIFVLEPLRPKHLAQLIKKIINHYANSMPIKIDRDAAEYLIGVACGDGRQIVSMLEIAIKVSDDRHITLELANAIAPSKYYKYTPDLKHDIISWYQGAIQASDPDAAIYALAMALESGEDPRYIARRLLVSAAEDAASTPSAVAAAHAAYTAACQIGRPECDIVLAQATILTATAPRSKVAACAIWEALKDIRRGENIEIPKEMRDCHYAAAAELEHGAYHDGMNMDQYVGISKKYYRPEDWQ